MEKLQAQVSFVLMSVSTRNPDFWGQVKWTCRNASNVAGTYNPNHNAIYDEIKSRYIRLGCPFLSTQDQRIQVIREIREFKGIQNEKDNVLGMGS